MEWTKQDPRIPKQKYEDRPDGKRNTGALESYGLTRIALADQNP
jgi:hypothetical protein